MHMLLLEGIPVSPDYGSGIAIVYDYEVERRLEMPHRAINSQHAGETSNQALRCRRPSEVRELLSRLRSRGGVGDTCHDVGQTATSSRLSSGSQ
jgi:hypothetical protein